MQPETSEKIDTFTAEDLCNLRRQRSFRFLRYREWVVLSIILAGTIYFGLNFKPVRVVGISMEPTFHNGATLLVRKEPAGYTSYSVGDVIVFRANDGTELIKRIAYIQDPLGIRRMPNRLWTPTGYYTPLELMLISNRADFPGYWENIARGLKGQTVYRPVFVMGDNTWKSDDSRLFGPIAFSAILGKVVGPLPFWLNWFKR